MHNYSNSIYKIFSGLLIVFVTQGVLAEEKRQLEAHEHGHGTLNIAIEANQVEMELTVPGSDITGFEHEARTDGEKKILDTAIRKLKDPLMLFVFSKEAQCLLKSAKLETIGKGIHEEKHHQEEQHSKEHADDEETHNEFRLSYQITCQSPSRLTTIQFKYFDEFERAEELDVSLITESSQTKFEVTRDKPTIGLSGVM